MEDFFYQYQIINIFARHNGKFRNKNQTLRVSITNIISPIKMLNYRITRLLISMPLDSPDLKYGHVFISHPVLKQRQEKAKNPSYSIYASSSKTQTTIFPSITQSKIQTNFHRESPSSARVLTYTKHQEPSKILVSPYRSRASPRRHFILLVSYYERACFDMRIKVKSE